MADFRRESVSTTAYVALLTRHQKSLHAYIYSLVVDLEDADEVLQETNVRLWEQREDYDPNRPFFPWAKTVAYYHVLAQRTRKRRDRLQFSPAVLDVLSDDAEAITNEIADRSVALEQCVKKLNASSRKLLNLCYFGGHTIKDAASQLGRSVAATYKALARIRKSLYDCVEKSLSAEAGS